MLTSVKDAAMLWEPLQVVSGDFVWSSEVDGKTVFFVADCTGHGVPGALSTMVVSSELKKLLDLGELADPEQWMLDLDRGVRQRLGQDRPSDAGNDNQTSDDGFEAALAIYDPAKNTLTFIGASIPLYVQSSDGIKRIPADCHRLGYRSLRRPESFKSIKHAYWHAAGDEALRFVAPTLENASGLAGRLCRILSDIVIQEGGTSFSLTTSFRVAAMVGPKPACKAAGADAIKQFFQQDADDALSEAKGRGRNKTVNVIRAPPDC